MSDQKTVYVVQYLNEFSGEWTDNHTGPSQSLIDAKLLLNSKALSTEMLKKPSTMCRWRIIKRTEEVVYE